MATIQSWQIKTIYAIGNRLDMSQSSPEDELHVLVCGLTNKSSIKALTDAEADNVIAELKKRQTVAGIKPKSPKPAQRRPAVKPGGVTAAQQSKIWALMGALENLDTIPSKATYRERLCGIIQKEFGMDAAPIAPFQWLTMKQGIQLIDTLKRYVANTELKVMREGQVHKNG